MCRSGDIFYYLARVQTLNLLPKVPSGSSYATRIFTLYYYYFFQRPREVVAIKAITKKNLAKSQNLLGKEIKILKVSFARKQTFFSKFFLRSCVVGIGAKVSYFVCV